jgi:hypothetical protein
MIYTKSNSNFLTQNYLKMKSTFFFSKLFFAFFSLTLIIGCAEEDDPNCPKSLQDGYEEYITYKYFNENSSPTISVDPTDQSSGDVTGFIVSSAEIDADKVLISIKGLRVRSNSYNYEISDFYIDEAGDDNCYIFQSENNLTLIKENVDIASVLVLDMSTSLGTFTDSIKIYAKDYATEITNSSSNSQVAVVFFSSNAAITPTDWYNEDNVSELRDEIDAFDEYTDETALLQATVDGINLVNNLTFNGDKSVVVFTDGGDNASGLPSTLKDEIAMAPENISRYAIGLRKGADFNEQTLEDIASSPGNLRIAEESEFANLGGYFDVIARGVQAVYSVSYSRSKQILTEDRDAKKIRFQMETLKIE